VDACIVDLPVSASNAITSEEVERAVLASSMQKGDAMLLHTGWGDNERYYSLGDDYVLTSPWLSSEGAEKITELCREYECQILGYDTANLMDYQRFEDWYNRCPRPPNFPSQEAKDYWKDKAIAPSSSTILKIQTVVPVLLAGVVNLGEARKKRLKLIALPLKLRNLEGGPVRAVLIEE